MSGGNQTVAVGTEQNHADGRLQRILVPGLTALAALIVYLLTMAPDLTWANYGSDGGELITASLTSGIAHPPGYPTYLFLGKIAALLPFGNTAWRFNFFSAISAATAVAFVTAAAQQGLGDTKREKAAAAATGLCLAFAPLFWGQALISEVYALNMAVLSALLWSLLNRRWPLLSGLLLGVAITTHLSSLIMLPLALTFTTRERWLRLVSGILLGLLPYLSLPILARSGSPVIWGDPTTPQGWWWLVSGQLYYANLRLPESGSALTKLSILVKMLLRQWLWVGWLVVVLGMTARVLEKKVVIALTATGLLYFLYGFLYQTEDVFVTLLPLLLLFSPLLAAGFSKFGSWSLILPILLLLVNYQALTLHQDLSVRPLAEDVLNSAPEKAVLLTTGDKSIFTLWYFHYVEEMRPDLSLVDTNLFAFDWYRERLGLIYPQLSALEEDNLVEFKERNSRKRPVCEVPAALDGPISCSGGPE